MLFVVLFTDLPDQGALRATHLQAHIDWVAAHQAQVRVAGSLREQLGQVPKVACGSLSPRLKKASIN